MKWIKLLLPLLLGVVSITSIGVVYTQCIQPNEAVWLPNARHWANTPLKVEITDFHEASRDAIKLWNNRIGCPIFREDNSNPNIIIKSADASCGTPLSREDYGGAYLCGQTAEVHVAYPGDLWQQLYIIHHELGHVIGLAHDDRGAMAPLPRREIHGPDPIIRATDKDTDAIRKRYCE